MMIGVDLNKQQAPDADSAKQQVKITGNLDRAGNTTMFPLLEKKILDFRFFAMNCESDFSKL